MKTTEEIKQGFRACHYDRRCDKCPYHIDGNGFNVFSTKCMEDMGRDALEYIKQLEDRASCAD